MTAATLGHRYRVGERVVLDARVGYYLKSGAAFIVVAQLPPLGSDYQYRIKSVGEPHERVALEHHLSQASSGEGTERTFFKERETQA
ncbi:hypothetical protein [Methylovirgula sp. HY1]|uniref:hypothetical protein n=1 Tax=Methylovirgula sp. HY1 TaxID=2822761 RepID=UPI001C5B4DB8|nr:hypothetical protein [Methylovirgula sp. HY1]QXX76411.1 hypothetical protein MHY1_03251 [Methylovirgula sp. HY1]